MRMGARSGAASLTGIGAARRSGSRKVSRWTACSRPPARLTATLNKLAQLKTLKPLKVMPKQQGGKPFFVVADPYQCVCLYVGNEAGYDTYQRLALRQEYVQDRLATAEMNEAASMDWGMWGGPWGGWY
jgi:hypothetical protein